MSLDIEDFRQIAIRELLAEDLMENDFEKDMARATERANKIVAEIGSGWRNSDGSKRSD